MLETRTRAVCRLARPEDDLSEVIGKASMVQWNRDQILVAELDGRIVGMLILWDGGHGVVKCDHLNCTPQGVAEGVGAKLILCFNEYCQSRGKQAMSYTTPSLEIAYHAKRRHAQVTGPLFGVVYWITDRRGASHG